jgi:hypothetical protein
MKKGLLLKCFPSPSHFSPFRVSFVGRRKVTPIETVVRQRTITSVIIFT